MWARSGRCKTDSWVQRNCLNSCNVRGTCDRKQIKPEGTVVCSFAFLLSFQFLGYGGSLLLGFFCCAHVFAHLFLLVYSLALLASFVS